MLRNFQSAYYGLMLNYRNFRVIYEACCATWHPCNPGGGSEVCSGAVFYPDLNLAFSKEDD